MLLSKKPLSNLRFARFPLAAGQDSHARKGVLTADVALGPGAAIRLGVRHALTPFMLDGQPHLFALKSWPHHERVIARLYDYSWD